MLNHLTETKTLKWKLLQSLLRNCQQTCHCYKKHLEYWHSEVKCQKKGQKHNQTPKIIQESLVKQKKWTILIKMQYKSQKLCSKIGIILTISLRMQRSYKWIKILSLREGSL